MVVIDSGLSSACCLQACLDRDVVIYIEQDQPFAPRAIVEHDPVNQTNVIDVACVRLFWNFLRCPLCRLCS